MLRWAAFGEVAGLRIDHPDGLADPAGYLERLLAAPRTACGPWSRRSSSRASELPDWPVAGTTGYDAMAEVDGVLVDPAGEAAFTALDERLTGVRTSWPDLVHDCKLDVATGLLRAEVRRMAGLAAGIPAVEEPLAELLACFPVYRSYLPVGAGAPRRGAGRGPPAAAGPVLRRAGRPAAPTPPTSWPYGSSRSPAR